MDKKAMTEALRKVIEYGGVETIKNERKLKALLTDFLPTHEYKAEKRALLTATDVEYWRLMVEMHEEGRTQHNRAVEIIFQHFKEELGWTDERALLVLECYVDALGWTGTEMPVISQPPETVPQAMPPVQTKQTNVKPNDIMRFASMIGGFWKCAAGRR